jgi:hypothetical protein
VIPYDRKPDVHAHREPILRSLWLTLLALPPRIKVVLVCALIGVPAWIRFHDRMLSPQERLDAMAQADAHFATCMAHLDPNAGTLNFLHQQRQREQDGGL